MPVRVRYIQTSRSVVPEVGVRQERRLGCGRPACPVTAQGRLCYGRDLAVVADLAR